MTEQKTEDPRTRLEQRLDDLEQRFWRNHADIQVANEQDGPAAEAKRQALSEAQDAIQRRMDDLKRDLTRVLAGEPAEAAAKPKGEAAIPATRRDIRVVARAIDAGLDAVKGYIDRGFADVDKRLAALEATGLKYSGTWQRAQDYQRGAVVTDQDSAWVALKAGAGERPGEVPAAWQLLVKAGRDGRDAAPATKAATAVKLEGKS